MAIPSGYRLITSSDVGKIFGTDIENIVYFDTTVSATSVYGLTNNPTLVTFTIGKNSETTFGFKYSDPPDADILCISTNTDVGVNSGGADIFVIDTEFGSVWSKDNYDFTGVGSITAIDSGFLALNVMYVKDIAQELTVAEKLVATNDEKLALKTALEGKSVDMTNIPFTQYHEKVTALPSPKEEETKTVTPNFASGDMVVNPTTNKVMTQITFTKDTTNHIAGNIKSGVTLYGISGNVTPAKSEETKTVDLSMASGNQVVTPTTNKVMTQVTINKPATLLPANIKKDIVIGGVTGTLESGGGGIAFDVNKSYVMVNIDTGVGANPTLTYSLSSTPGANVTVSPITTIFSGGTYVTLVFEINSNTSIIIRSIYTDGNSGTAWTTYAFGFNYYNRQTDLSSDVSTGDGLTLTFGGTYYAYAGDITMLTIGLYFD
jgi:hypothetical protein